MSCWIPTIFKQQISPRRIPFVIVITKFVTAKLESLVHSDEKYAREKSTRTTTTHINFTQHIHRKRNKICLGLLNHLITMVEKPFPLLNRASNCTLCATPLSLEKRWKKDRLHDTINCIYQTKLDKTTTPKPCSRKRNILLANLLNHTIITGINHQPGYQRWLPT